MHQLPSVFTNSFIIDDRPHMPPFDISCTNDFGYVIGHTRCCLECVQLITDFTTLLASSVIPSTWLSSISFCSMDIFSPHKKFHIICPLNNITTFLKCQENQFNWNCVPPMISFNVWLQLNRSVPISWIQLDS